MALALTARQTPSPSLPRAENTTNASVALTHRRKYSFDSNTSTHQPQNINNPDNARVLHTIVLAHQILRPLVPLPPNSDELLESDMRNQAKRLVFKFQDNITISRMNDGVHNHSQGILPKEVENHPDSAWSRIRDHAFRRMVILYHQFVVFQNEECEVTKGKTRWQHGSSSCPHCAAAHSAILPRLKDNTFDILEHKIATGGLTADIEDRLRAFGANDEAMANLAERVKTSPETGSYLSTLGIELKTGLISKGTHLWNVCNSTVEVPKVVNEFDQLIERRMRPEALVLVNEVSKGNVDPYTALKQFGTSLRQYLEESNQVTLDAIDLITRKEKIENKIKEHERKFDGSDKWTEEYISYVYLLCDTIVKITDLPKDKLLYTPEMTWPEGRENLFGNIIMSKMLKDYVYIDSITDHRQLRKSCGELCDKIANQQAKEEIRSALNSNVNPANINELKMTVLQILKKLDPVSSLMHPARISKIKSDINIELSTHPQWNASSHLRYKQKLQNLLKVIEWEAEGTQEAPENYLVGGYQSLEEMKTDLITRKHFPMKAA